MTDRLSLVLVALYDIRPGNGAGPFLQPRSPHGASQLGEGTELQQKRDTPPGSHVTRPVIFLKGEAARNVER